ncbi:hypothetical protein CHM34_11115 [Paludifilum halophilum]|nr:hypothetical protein CHM34_11115 [Paludifilum halophilum]
MTGRKKWAVILLASVTLVGCSSGDGEQAGGSSPDFPDFVTSASAPAREAYQMAFEHPDVLTYMPCYCGCGETSGHKNNWNCFIKDQRENGEVIWDPMGAT